MFYLVIHGMYAKTNHVLYLKEDNRFTEGSVQTTIYDEMIKLEVEQNDRKSPYIWKEF